MCLHLQAEHKYEVSDTVGATDQVLDSLSVISLDLFVFGVDSPVIKSPMCLQL